MNAKHFVGPTIRALLLTVALLAALLFLVAWTQPLAENANATFLGQAGYDRAGERLAVVGDVNGDGYDDFVVGARHASVVGTQAGAAYLLLGEAAAGWGFGFQLPLADATFGSAGYQDYVGRDVAGAGDVNGDGLDDFLVGASGYDAPGAITQTGKVYLLLGRAAADWGTGFDLDTGADASFIGEAAYDHAGYALSSAGDVDGDGYADFLVGAYDNDQGGVSAGKAYLFLGRQDAGWGLNLSLDLADASFLGAAYEQAGITVAGAGDVNGDGLSDLLIGSALTDAYLFLGRAAADWGQDVPLAGADVVLHGASIGAVVAGAGDVNGDGLDDMLVGASHDDEGGEKAGKVYLLFGREAADWGSPFDLAGADASFYGAFDYESAGCALSTAGDVNRDGYDDFLAGAYQQDPTGGDVGPGRAYLILGHPGEWHTGTPLADAATARDLWALDGEVLGDQAGSDVAGGGDVNGDGFADLIVGAQENADANVSAGKAYLVLGRGLDLTKAAHAATVAPGEPITYTMRYTNSNSWSVQQVRIFDRFPDDTIYVGCTGGITCNRQGTQVYWFLGTVVTNTAATVGLIVSVPADLSPGTVLTNTAWITAPSRVNPVFSTVTTRVEARGRTVYLPVVLRSSP